MDRINVESMRKMMMMQEQVFKHQVQELHRLYNLQKKLMDEIENESKRRRDDSTTPSSVDHFDEEVDLTLSIGHPRTKLQKSKSKLDKCSLDSDQSNEGCSSGRQDEHGSQDNGPRRRWLMQDLRLNRR